MFGIDLHWLPHAQGALAIAEMVKRLHPKSHVLFGGLSASYYHDELVRYPFVDFVIRGDSTEEPVRQLLQALREGSRSGDVENLTWKRADGSVVANPLTFIPGRPRLRRRTRLPVRHAIGVQVREPLQSDPVHRVDAVSPHHDPQQPRLHPGLLRLWRISLGLSTHRSPSAACLSIAGEAGRRLAHHHEFLPGSDLHGARSAHRGHASLP